MRRVFADTSYWIALLSLRDHFHQKALTLSREYPPNQILTTDLVLIEFLNWFSDRFRFRAGASRAVLILKSRGVTVVSQQGAEAFDKALKLYSDMIDKSWSFTDCASFNVMESQGIRDALTHDRHFEQAGFRALMR